MVVGRKTETIASPSRLSTWFRCILQAGLPLRQPLYCDPKLCISLIVFSSRMIA